MELLTRDNFREKCLTRDQHKCVVCGNTNDLVVHHIIESRSCPFLVKAVKKLGKKSYGPFAELEIIEIPDGVEWEIEEYDGIEWIAEKHRTWE